LFPPFVRSWSRSGVSFLFFIASNIVLDAQAFFPILPRSVEPLTNFSLPLGSPKRSGVGALHLWERDGERAEVLPCAAHKGTSFSLSSGPPSFRGAEAQHFLPTACFPSPPSKPDTPPFSNQFLADSLFQLSVPCPGVIASFNRPVDYTAFFPSPTTGTVFRAGRSPVARPVEMIPFPGLFAPRRSDIPAILSSPTNFFLAVSPQLIPILQMVRCLCGAPLPTVPHLVVSYPAGAGFNPSASNFRFSFPVHVC